MQKYSSFHRLVSLGFAMGIATTGTAWAQEQAVAMSATPHTRTATQSYPAFNDRKLYEAFGSLDAHGIRGTYYQSELKRLSELYADKSQYEAKRHALVRHVVADLRFGLGRTAGKDAQAERSAQLDALVAQLSKCSDMGECLQRFAARDRQYVPLQMMLAEYRSIAKDGGWPNVAGGAKLEPGAAGERVVQIAALLHETGDYSPAGSVSDSNYHPALEQAVKQFQSRHGLEADGVIGPKTLAAMNTPVQNRIEQIELSLDRLRQLADRPQGEHIRVNIPSYHLQAFSGESVALEMSVIVGQKSRKTPLFNNQITSMVVNPTWTPTPRIIREDILPKAQRDPGYLSGSYVVTDSYTGEQLDPYSVDWYSVSAGDVRIMQRSGAENALGKVKFDMPSSDAIYLHDTSKPQLFKESFRALSSGCVRVSEPEKLFSFISQAQGDAFEKRAAKQYASSTNSHLKLERPIPVTATYFTAWVNQNGKVEFYDDVYQRDAQARLAWNKHESNQFVSR